MNHATPKSQAPPSSSTQGEPTEDQAVEQTLLEDLRSTFIQNVSHEFRTPLGIIQGYAELLRDEDLGPLDDGQRNALSIIVSRVHELRKMVERIGILLSIEAHASVTVPLDLGEIVTKVVEERRESAIQAGVDLTMRLDPDRPLLSGDPYQLDQVVESLVENGIKFTPENGKVDVHMYAEPDWIVLSISDTGIGIPQEEMERIFGGFYQVDGSTTRQFGGIGLGLTLVKSVVEEHKGHVIVESEPGHGSHFLVKLPALPEELDLDSLEERESKVQSILIVDDEEFVVLTLQEALQKLPGCEVFVATNGKQALEFLEQRPVNLLITDYRMPDMDGMMLASRVRQKYPQTSVVVITAYNSDTLREQAARASVQSILDKPVKISEIRNVASTALKQAANHEPGEE